MPLNNIKQEHLGSKYQRCIFNTVESLYNHIIFGKKNMVQLEENQILFNKLNVGKSVSDFGVLWNSFSSNQFFELF